MIQYFTFNDISLGYSGQRMSPVEIAYIKNEAGVEMNNVLFDLYAAHSGFLDNVTREVRTCILSETDKIELPSFRDAQNIRMTDIQKQEIYTYRDALRDLPQTIIDSGYLVWSFPATPDFLPVFVKDKISDLETNYSVKCMLKYLKTLIK